MTEPAKKSIAQMFRRQAEEHPAVQLVPAVKDDQVKQPVTPDEAQEEHPKEGSEQCGATAYRRSDSATIACELELHHAGDHSYDGLMWRRRSGEDQQP